MRTDKKTIIAVMLFAVLAIPLFSSQFYVSMTWDEPLHIAAGYSKIMTGDYRMNTEHPPLMQMIEALPLLILKPKLNLEDVSWKEKKMLEFSRRFFFEDNKNPKQILNYARIPVIIITILLGLLIFKWAGEIAGSTAAIIALAIYTVEPNILANGILATTDMGFAAFATLAAYCYWKFFNKPNVQNLIITGVAMALAQLTKYTAIFLWPAYVLIILFAMKQYSSVQTGFKYPLQKKVLNKYYGYIYFHLISLAIISIISVVLINAAYLFHGTGVPIKQAMLADKLMDQNLYSPEKIFGTNKIINFITEKIPSPLPYYYTKGFGFVVNEGKNNHNPNLIWGRLYEHGSKAYFIAAFLSKTTIAFIILTIASILLLQKKQAKKTYWQFLLIPLLIILIAMSNSTKQLGIRYVLAIFPFLIIWISARITNAKLNSTTSNKYSRYIIAMLLLANAISSAAAFPAYLTYYNEAIGQKNGWKYFADNNTDWGQDFDKLVVYARCNPAVKIQYSGTNDLKFYNLETKKANTACEKEMLAISAREVMLNEKFKWLKNYEPVQQIGNSIILYNITNCTPATTQTK